MADHYDCQGKAFCFPTPSKSLCMQIIGRLNFSCGSSAGCTAQRNSLPGEMVHPKSAPWRKQPHVQQVSQGFRIVKILSHLEDNRFEYSDTLLESLNSSQELTPAWLVVEFLTKMEGVYMKQDEARIKKFWEITVLIVRPRSSLTRFCFLGPLAPWLFLFNQPHTQRYIGTHSLSPPCEVCLAFSGDISFGNKT